MLCVAVCALTTRASAATMSATVAQQSVAKGDTFVVEWYLDTEGVPINVVDATLYYSPETLKALAMMTGSSAVSLWIERPHVSETGAIRFVGGIPAGVTGHKIPILRTVFEATDIGTASIALAKNAQVVLSNGIATKESIEMQPIVFAIVPNKTTIIQSPTHPNQDKWYRDTRAIVRISEKNPIVYSLSANPEIIPGGDPVVVQEDIVYDNLRDGMYYFKVAAPLNGVLQELETYRILIDHTAPEVSAVEIDLHNEIYDQNASLGFYAVDKTSGIARTRVKVGWFGFYHEVTSPYRLHKPLFGNRVTLKVQDVAGNSTVSTLYYRGYLANWVSACVTLILLIWIVYIIIQKRRRICSLTKKVLRHFLGHSHSSQ